MLAAISYPPIPIFELGPLNLSLHGLFAGIGFVAGGSWIVRQFQRRRFKKEDAVSALTWGLVGAIIGIRLFTIPGHIGEAGYGLDDVFSLAGDYSILGGFAGGVLAGWIRFRMLGLNVAAALDMCAPGLALGAVVGRIGDLAIVEHLGSPTSFFLGFTLKEGYEIAPQHAALQRLCDELGQCLTYHHTALYDMIGALVLFGVLTLLASRWTYRYGQMFAVWTMWYGLQRFLIDFTRLEAARNDTVSDSVIGPFTGSQWGGLLGFALGLGLFLYARRREIVTPERDVQLGAEPVAV